VSSTDPVTRDIAGNEVEDTREAKAASVKITEWQCINLIHKRGKKRKSPISELHARVPPDLQASFPILFFKGERNLNRARNGEQHPRKCISDWIMLILLSSKRNHLDCSFVGFEKKKMGRRARALGEQLLLKRLVSRSVPVVSKGWMPCRLFAVSNAFFS
jgi:hypothetical protein